jgi:hypothetical protein
MDGCILLLSISFDLFLLQHNFNRDRSYVERIILSFRKPFLSFYIYLLLS